MPGLKHATKKRFAKTTTRKRTIKTGISAEYTEYKKKLDSVSTSIKSLVKEIRAARDVWLAVAKQQKDFSETLVASLHADGVVRSHAKEVESIVRQLQRLIIEDDSPTSPHKRMTSILESYLRLIQDVEKEYPQLETTYTEVLRYQKKVDKLSKNGKKENTLNRNMNKLTSARSEHDRRLAEVIARQKVEYEKHEAVFQCAHHAFWIAHDKYAHIVNETTKSIRWESVAVRERLVGMDVSKAAKLTAIPRVQTLLPPEEIREVQLPQIEEKSSGAVVETFPTRTIVETIPPQIAEPVPSQHVVNTVPTHQVVNTVPTHHVVNTVPTHHVVDTVPAQHVVKTAPTQHAVDPLPTRTMETVPYQGVPLQTMPIQTVPLHTAPVQKFETEPPVYTKNAPPPIHIAHPARAEVVHMVPATTYTYQQPVLHLTPEKPSVAVSVHPDAVGPAVPTELPQQPSAPSVSPSRAGARLLA